MAAVTLASTTYPMAQVAQVTQTTATKNVWWEFVKMHRKDVEHIKTRKERFRALSDMWKNEKANIITVHINYLSNLHNENATLKATINRTMLENAQLKEIMRLINEANESQ